MSFPILLKLQQVVINQLCLAATFCHSPLWLLKASLTVYLCEIIAYQTFPTYNKSAADDFEKHLGKIMEILYKRKTDY